MDTSRDAMEEEEESDEFLLLDKYCTRQEMRRLYRSGAPLLVYCQGSGPSRHSNATGVFKQSSIASGFSSMNVVESLADIADSVQIAEGDLKTEDSSPEHQQDLVEKLVELLKKEGDDMNEKIKQNKVLQQQLQGAISYSLFERLMAALQGGCPVGSAAQCTSAPSASEARLRMEQIAWTFEVTHRLSAIDQIPKRRALSFGSRYLRQHHSDWVQQHGGWQKVFTVKGAHGFI
ncbi:unnamed protein product [Lota lota]